MVCSSLRILICILRSGITKLNIFPVRWELPKRSFCIAMRSSLLEGQNLSTISSLFNKEPENLMICDKNTIWTVLRPTHWNRKSLSICYTVVGSEIRLSKQLSFLTYHISVQPFDASIRICSNAWFLFTQFHDGFLYTDHKHKNPWRKVTTKKR